jgi:hypothetical protein
MPSVVPGTTNSLLSVRGPASPECGPLPPVNQRADRQLAVTRCHEPFLLLPAAWRAGRLEDAVQNSVSW